MVSVDGNNPQQPQGNSLNSISRFTKDQAIADQFKLLFNLADTDGNGRVSKSEFQAFNSKVSAFLQNDKMIKADEVASVFDNSDKEARDSALNSYWSNTYGNLNDYNNYKKAFEKGDTKKMSKFDIKGIAEDIYNQFAEFCKSGWGEGESGNGVNGKLDLTDPNVRAFYQGSTGDCYLLSPVMAAALANGGDISSIVQSDGEGGAFITFQGMNDSEGNPIKIRVDCQVPILKNTSK